MTCDWITAFPTLSVLLVVGVLGWMTGAAFVGATTSNLSEDEMIRRLKEIRLHRKLASEVDEEMKREFGE